jgi:hypothetical protein
MYPHQNLNLSQRAALDRLYAPRFEFARYWATVECTDPDGKGVHFFPRVRRTWAFYVKGYVVVQLSGRVQPQERARRVAKLPYPLRKDGTLKW